MCLSTCGGYADWTITHGLFFNSSLIRILLSPSANTRNSGQIKLTPIALEIFVAKSRDDGPAITTVEDNTAF
jgi:hypothetical protein